MGTVEQTFYNDGDSNTKGTQSYALITDFDPDEDTIELSGSKTNYRLDISPIDTVTGTAIYQLNNDTNTEELIAIIQ